jgi:hypothetical protein
VANHSPLRLYDFGGEIRLRGIAGEFEKLSEARFGLRVIPDDPDAGGVVLDEQVGRVLIEISNNGFDADGQVLTGLVRLKTLQLTDAVDSRTR